MTHADYCGFDRWDWMQTLANVLRERALVGKHIMNYGWDDLPAELQADFNDVITGSVDTFGGPWWAAMYDGWYSFVAPEVTRE